MANLADYVKTKEFKSRGESFPEGETVIDTEKAEIEETVKEFDGETKIRYLIKHEGKEYYAGPQIMKQLKKHVEDGHTKVSIIRQGQGLETQYMVVPIRDA